MSGTDPAAVVTGASGGIGAAVARALAAADLHLHLIGRDEARLEQVAAAAGPGRCRTYAVDLADPDALDALGRRLGDLARVDILVHAAGAIALGPLAAVPLSDLDRLWRTNLRAPLALTQALLPGLAACGGQIVFINSSAGLAAGAGNGAYAATKHALKAVADTLRAEVNERGMRVVSVYPGRTASPMQEAVHRVEGRPYAPDQLLQPADVAQAILAALSLPRTAEATDIQIRPSRRPV